METTQEQGRSKNDVILRDVQADDLPHFFEQQLDPDANWMAAFTSKDPSDRDAFSAHWARIMNDESITIQTIIYRDEVAGHILVHNEFDEPQITYWIGRQFWGNGVATSALAAFLDLVPTRPLYGHVAKDNIGSRRVLEKCGFQLVGEDSGFANARGEETEEYVLVLTEPTDS